MNLRVGENLPPHNKTLEDQMYQVTQDHKELHHFHAAILCFQYKFLGLESKENKTNMEMIQNEKFQEIKTGKEKINI